MILCGGSLRLSGIDTNPREINGNISNSRSILNKFEREDISLLAGPTIFAKTPTSKAELLYESEDYTDINKYINKMLLQPNFYSLQLLLVSLQQTIEHCNCNINLAKALCKLMYRICVFIATPKYGLIDRAVKKKVALPVNIFTINSGLTRNTYKNDTSNNCTISVQYSDSTKAMSEIENNLDILVRHMRRFTSSKSILYLLVNENSEYNNTTTNGGALFHVSTNCHTEKIINLVINNFNKYFSQLQSCYYVKQEGVILNKNLLVPSSYPIISNLRQKVEERLIQCNSNDNNNNDNNIENNQLKYMTHKEEVYDEDTDPTIITERNDNTSQGPTIIEYTKVVLTNSKVVEEMNDVVELIHALIISSENNVRVGIHTYIPQLALQYFWRDLIGTNAINATTKDFFHKLVSFLMDEISDGDGCNETSASSDVSANLKIAQLCISVIKIIKTFNNTIFEETEEEVEYDAIVSDNTFVNIFDVIKVSRNIDPNNDNLMKVLEMIHLSNISTKIRSTKIIKCLPALYTQAYYESNIDKGINSLSFAVPVDNSDIISLLTKVNGWVLLRGPAYCGKSHQLLTLCHYNEFFAKKSIIYLDLEGVSSVNHGLHRIAAQLQIQKSNIDDIKLEIALLLDVIPNNSIIILDNVSFTNSDMPNSMTTLLDILLNITITSQERMKHCYLLVTRENKIPEGPFKVKFKEVLRRKLIIKRKTLSESHSLCLRIFPYDPTSLAIAGRGLVGLMVNLASVCSLKTIRLIAMEISKFQKAKEYPNEDVEIRISSPQSIMEILYHGVLNEISDDEALLLSCLLFKQSTPDALYMFHESLIYFISKEVFDEDILRYSIAIEGLKQAGILMYRSDFYYTITPLLRSSYAELFFSNNNTTPKKKNSKLNLINVRDLLLALHPSYKHSGKINTRNNIPSNYLSTGKLRDLYNLYFASEIQWMSGLQSFSTGQSVPLMLSSYQYHHFKHFLTLFDENESDIDIIAFTKYLTSLLELRVHTGIFVIPTANSRDYNMNIVHKLSGNVSIFLSHYFDVSECQTLIYYITKYICTAPNCSDLIYFRAILDYCNTIVNMLGHDMRVINEAMSLMSTLLQVFSVDTIPSKERTNAVITLGKIQHKLGLFTDAIVSLDEAAIALASNGSYGNDILSDIKEKEIDAIEKQINLLQQKIVKQKHVDKCSIS